MKGAGGGADFFPSNASLDRFYTLGGSGDETGQVGNASLDVRLATTTSDGAAAAPQTVLMSSASGDPYVAPPRAAAFPTFFPSLAPAPRVCVNCAAAAREK